MKKLFTIFFCLGLCGCTTAGSINKNFSEVDYTDGVDAKEARWLAQKHCLDTKECKGYIISQGTLTDGDSHKITHDFYAGKWVIFYNEVLTVLIIEIDKKTGEVLVRTDGI